MSWNVSWPGTNRSSNVDHAGTVTTTTNCLSWVQPRIHRGSGSQCRRLSATLAAASSNRRPGSYWPLPGRTISSTWTRSRGSRWVCLVIVVSFACWLPFVRGLNRAISRMTGATAQIAEGRFGTELPGTRHDELGELSASIQRMASRLDRLVNGQKRFLRDAAHELRSPLPRMQVALGLLDRSAAPEQRSVLADLREDVENMGALVDDVLSFSKATRNAGAPELADVPLAELVARVVEREGAAGSITACVDPKLVARDNRESLFRAVSNVLRNAVRYAGSAGPIEASARAHGHFVTLSVFDQGPGVPETDLEAILG